MLPISPPDRMDQLITVFSQRLQPLTLQRLSVAEILQDASALAIMQEEIPTMDNFHVLKQQKSCFGRMLKFLHLHEPTGYEKDEEHKSAAVRYLALRTMLQQCNDIKISSIQEACLDKVLRWFEATETKASGSTTASTPILPPRMSPKKPCFPPALVLDKSSSDSCFLPITTASSTTAIAAKLEKYKMPDLRASHIRRIAELRSRGAEISEKNLPIEEDNNHRNRKPQNRGAFQIKEDEKRMVEATFKMYHPETDAERDMNLLWIRRRKEDEIKRKKDEEVQQRVHKWAMDRSRDESETLRKRESTKLVAGLGQILQEDVDQDKPFAWRSSHVLHPNLAGMAAQSNQSAAVAPTKAGAAATKEPKEKPEQDGVTSSKTPVQTRASSKQPVQIVIKTRKSSVNAGGGMHFRNQLPPNYVPPGHAALSVPKSKGEASSATINTKPSTTKESSGALRRLERRASAVSDEESSASEDEEEDPVSDDSAKRKRTSSSREDLRPMTLQSYHVPYYYTDGTEQNAVVRSAALQKPHPRGTIPMQPVPADPELRCLQEASAMRRVFAIPIDKYLQKPNSRVVQPVSGRETERGASSSRKSVRSEGTKPRRGSKSAKGKRLVCRTAPTEPLFTASTSDLRQSQMEEMDKIRRLFEQNNLSLPAHVLERGLLVPEDRPLVETIANLPFAGDRLLTNPLSRKSNPAKPKKKPSGKKKKTKKTKKGAKTSK